MAEDKIFNIPLGEAYKKAKLKRAAYSARIIKNFLADHTKANEIKIGTHLNHTLWQHGVKKPQKMVRVKAVIEGKTVKAELIGHEYVDFKAKPKKEKKSAKERLLERLGPKALKKEEEAKVAEGKKITEIKKDEKTAEKKIEKKKEEIKTKEEEELEAKLKKLEELEKKKEKNSS